MNMGVRILIALAFFSTTTLIVAQGCSDAGVCTAGPIGALHLVGDSTVAAKEYRHLARLTFSYGIGEQGTTIVQVVPELNLGLTERLSLQLKVPYVNASGDLGENSGVGDLLTTVSYAFIKERERNFTGIVGIRFPTGKTAADPIQQTTFGSDFKPLPMPYQTGLGTTDLLLGAQYRRDRWSGALAYQRVMDQNNENLFQHRYWSDEPAALPYFESFFLERADDAVVRVQYAFPLWGLTLQPGLLAIYHMDEDTRLETVGNASNLSADPMERRPIIGSEGLTLNLTADARYAFNDQWALEVAMGTPLIVRDVRPDGLTRSLVLNVGLRYAF